MDNLPSSVTDARTKASDAAQTASDFASASYTIPDQLKKVIDEALNYNKDIIDLRSSALSDYIKAPSDASAKFGVDQFSTGPNAGQDNPDYIFNPFERNKAIGDFTSNQEVPFLTSNALLGMRLGSNADLVKAGTNAFKGQASAVQAASDAAAKAYEDTLKEFKTTEDIKAQNRQLDIQQQEANTKGASVKKVDPTDQNNAIISALGAVTQGASKITADKGFVTQKDIQDLWNIQIPLLKNLGIDDNIIATYIKQTLSASDVRPANFVQKNVLGDFFQNLSKPNKTPLTSTQPLINMGDLGSNIQRGLSNVGTFLGQFNTK